MATPPLYKTSVVIWSRVPGDQMELSALAREAESGDAYCALSRSELVRDPEQDPDWDGTEFFFEDPDLEMEKHYVHDDCREAGRHP